MEDVVASVEEHWSGVPFALECGVADGEAENREGEIEETGSDAEDSGCFQGQETGSKGKFSPDYVHHVVVAVRMKAACDDHSAHQDEDGAEEAQDHL